MTFRCFPGVGRGGARIETRRARVHRLIAAGRTKTRPETSAIMREIDSRTASATTASKDVISDVVRRGATFPCDLASPPLALHTPG